MNREISDIYFLKKTFRLALKAKGMTSPNPLVGAVIVKNAKVLAQGFHRQCGFPHAEIEAMRKAAGVSLSGATLYLNLEPCAHYGRTPPCVDEVIKNKFKRVVISDIDPNPLVRGKAIKKMQAAGIEIKVGLLRDQARRLNEVFYKNMIDARPFVAAKTGQSLDGKIAISGGQSQWITNEDSRILAKKLRDIYDCVLVGVNTVVKDNPGLEGRKKIPWRAVIDPHLRVPLSWKAFRVSPEKVVLFVSSRKKKSPKLKNIPPEVSLVFIDERQGLFSVRKILAELFKRGIMSVYLEGGAATLGAFFDAQAVDKIYFFIAAKIIGGINSLSSVGGRGVSAVKESVNIKSVKLRRLGSDIFIEGYPEYSQGPLKHERI